MVPRLALFALSVVPAVVVADSSIANGLLRGSPPELVQQAAGSRREGFMTRGLGGEDPKGGSYEHLGCFVDDREDRILGSKLVSPEMTAMICHTHCDAMNAAYMATQYGSECWCSQRGDLDYKRHEGIGKCDSPCSGDESETCGGVHAFDMYRMDWAPAPSGPEYKGCYKDMKDARLMDDRMTLDNMIPDLCREHCMGKGVKTYATQYGNECWCGSSDALEDYTKHGEGVCHMRCAGDDSIACGGYNSLGLFQMGDMERAPTPAPSEKVKTGDYEREPYTQPTAGPTMQPSAEPTMEPSAAPSSEPSAAPSSEPSAAPSSEPSAAPSSEPSAAPSSEPSAAPSSQPSAEPSTDRTSGGGDAGDYAELLAIHNRKRCMHNAEPLVWDDEIFKVAKAYAATLTNSQNCGTIFHSKDNDYGENLHYCGHTSGYGCYSDEKAMTGLFDEELVVPSDVATYGLHATQIAWKSTKRVGCAVDTCESGGYYYHTLVCNYDPAGNYLAKLKEEVEPPSKSESACR